MADIQLIQCKNQQKTSSYRRNIVPYKEIGIKDRMMMPELEPEVHKWPLLRMRSEKCG